MSDVRDKFLKKLYDMSRGELTTIDRYELGKELDLPKEETDAIVEELTEMGMIKKVAGTKILLTLEGKNEFCAPDNWAHQEPSPSPDNEIGGGPPPPPPPPP
jgi:Mn-dependent DtxR family transcriptional regulator